MSESHKEHQLKVDNKDQQKNLQNPTNNGQILQQNGKKRRKIKKAKIKPKHPPQYYEQLRKQKQLKKRQLQWDSRFNFSIPGLNMKQVKKVKTRSKLKSLKRSDSPKQSAVEYLTYNQESTAQPKPSKSFNIRIMLKKEHRQQSLVDKKLSSGIKNQKHNEGKQTQQKIRQDKIKQKQKQRQRQTQQTQQKNQLITQLTKAFQSLKFLQSHFNILLQIIKKSKSKLLKNCIQSEVQKIKSKTSSCSTIQTLLIKRNKLIDQLKQSKQNRNAQQITQYQISTLKIIQQILKWRDQMQSMYYQLIKNKVKVVLEIDKQNYLYTIYRGFNLKQKSEDKNGNQKEISFEGNPFMLGYQNIEVKQNLILKIRACEMMLLEQQICKLEN